MNTAEPPTAHAEGDTSLTSVIAAVWATSALSPPACVALLISDVVDALLEEIFGNTLIHP
ncbi:hypothetical protein [Corynebacterium sp. A21]|uniref:hypothetical protein n=1 Tax=Corynebacterium sp. A21 TaxID=3457318 RepID=UPI003FD3A2A6